MLTNSLLIAYKASPKFAVQCPPSHYSRTWLSLLIKVFKLNSPIHLYGNHCGRQLQLWQLQVDCSCLVNIKIYGLHWAIVSLHYQVGFCSTWCISAQWVSFISLPRKLTFIYLVVALICVLSTPSSTLWFCHIQEHSYTHNLWEKSNCYLGFSLASIQQYVLQRYFCDHTYFLCQSKLI